MTVPLDQVGNVTKVVMTLQAIAMKFAVINITTTMNQEYWSVMMVTMIATMVVAQVAY